jgi:mannose-6-phosphate isomerase-like protein (cupin superfamily)
MMHIEHESSSVRAGQIILIPAGASQHITNTGHGDLEFLCIVAPKWQSEDEELTG